MKIPVGRLAVCTFALAMLVSVLACGGPKSADESAAPPMAAPQASAGPAAALPDSARALVIMLPDELALPGFTRPRAPKRYGPGDLWEYIDGAAETVLAYGFQELITAGYAAGPGGVEITADLYRMADGEASFGLYAQELDPASKTLAIGAEAALRSTSLVFWAGPHVVKLTAFKEDPASATALETLARAIAPRIGQAGTRPAAFARFPATGLVPRSFRVVPKDPLGQSYLPKGYSAQYESDGHEWTLMSIPFESAAAAEAGFRNYQAFVGSGGTAPTPLAGVGDASFSGTDSFYGLVVAARAGAAMGVALGAPTVPAGRTAVAAALGKPGK